MIFVPSEEEIKSKIKTYFYKDPNNSYFACRLYEYADDVVGYKSVTETIGRFCRDEKIDELVKKVRNAYYKKRLDEYFPKAAQIPKQMLMSNTVHIPDEKMIRDRIKVYQDYDIERDMIILLAVYKDDVVGEVKTRDEIPYPRFYDLKDLDYASYYDRVKYRLTYEVLSKYEDIRMKGENKEMDYNSLCAYLKMKDAIIDGDGYAILKNDRNYKKEAKNMMKPTIAKIEFYNDRVTKVTWKDGSFTKSVCGENDVFNKDIGVTICLIKKMLGGQKNGTNAYMKFLKDAKNVLENQEKEKTAEDEAKRIAKEKQKKHALRIAKRKQKKEQEQIDIQKAAFVAAMHEIEGEKKQCACQKSEKASTNKTLKKECKK